jgi:hypothetical protein
LRIGRVMFRVVMRIRRPPLASTSPTGSTESRRPGARRPGAATRARFGFTLIRFWCRKRLNKLTGADVRQLITVSRSKCLCCLNGYDRHRLPEDRCCSAGRYCGWRPSNRQIQFIHAVLRNALSSAERDELVTRNVAKLVQIPTPRYKVGKGLRVADVKRLLVEAKKTGCMGSTWWRPRSACAAGSCSACAGSTSTSTAGLSASSRRSSGSRAGCCSTRPSRRRPRAPFRCRRSRSGCCSCTATCRRRSGSIPVRFGTTTASCFPRASARRSNRGASTGISWHPHPRRPAGRSAARLPAHRRHPAARAGHAAARRQGNRPARGPRRDPLDLRPHEPRRDARGARRHRLGDLMGARCYTVATFWPVVDLTRSSVSRLTWSGWRDLNPRPLAPKASALPSCATPRPPQSTDHGVKWGTWATADGWSAGRRRPCHQHASRQRHTVVVCKVAAPTCARTVRGAADRREGPWLPPRALSPTASLPAARPHRSTPIQNCHATAGPRHGY